MLRAKKEALENSARVKLIEIREKELDYYTANCRNIGQCAALVSGMAYSGIRYHYLLSRKNNYRLEFEDSLEECARDPRHTLRSLLAVVFAHTPSCRAALAAG